MFACLLVVQYDTYNVAYMYLVDITAKKTKITRQLWYPSGHLVPKWRRIDVDAT